VGQGNTYSFKSLTGVMVNPVFGMTIPLTGGNIGAGSFNVAMTTERTVHDVAADGTVMVSYVAGDNGTLDVECQESSLLHQELLAMYNLCLLAANNDDVSGWAATTISFRMLTDGSQHLFSGVSFSKFPDKPYQAHGQRVTWRLMAANAIHM
jgi:Bacteriophage KPP10, Structural protein ORF10